jgi:hypothetical protein
VWIAHHRAGFIEVDQDGHIIVAQQRIDLGAYAQYVEVSLGSLTAILDSDLRDAAVPSVANRMEIENQFLATLTLTQWSQEEMRPELPTKDFRGAATATPDKPVQVEDIELDDFWSDPYAGDGQMPVPSVAEHGSSSGGALVPSVAECEPDTDSEYQAANRAKKFCHRGTKKLPDFIPGGFCQGYGKVSQFGIAAPCPPALYGAEVHETWDRGLYLYCRLTGEEPRKVVTEQMNSKHLPVSIYRVIYHMGQRGQRPQGPVLQASETRCRQTRTPPSALGLHLVQPVRRPLDSRHSVGR